MSFSVAKKKFIIPVDIILFPKGDLNLALIPLKESCAQTDQNHVNWYNQKTETTGLASLLEAVINYLLALGVEFEHTKYPEEGS